MLAAEYVPLATGKGAPSGGMLLSLPLGLGSDLCTGEFSAASLTVLALGLQGPGLNSTGNWTGIPDSNKWTPLIAGAITLDLLNMAFQVSNDPKDTIAVGVGFALVATGDLFTQGASGLSLGALLQLSYHLPLSRQ
jgi:hypothetical protein